jgi:MFS family permease
MEKDLFIYSQCLRRWYVCQFKKFFLIFQAIMVWQPYTKTTGQYLASKILQGFFGAPIESLCEISVADIYFRHERGTYLGLYAFMLSGSNFLAPVLAGFITDGQGWQWIFYWCAIFLAIGFVFNFFLMEETNYGKFSLMM